MCRPHVTSLLVIAASLPAASASYSGGGKYVEWLSAGTIFQVKERHAGVCYYKGKLEEKVYLPGRHWKYPDFFENCFNICVADDIEIYENLQCGAKGTAEALVIPKVRVKFRLPEAHVLTILREQGRDFEDKLIEYHLQNYVNRMCSEMTVDQVHTTEFAQMEDRIKQELVRLNTDNGLVILDVDVPKKPELPTEYKLGYNARAAAETAKDEQKKMLVTAEAQAQQKVIEAKNANAIAILQAEQKAAQTKIEADTKKMQELYAAQSDAARKKLEVDADFYVAQKMAEAKRQTAIMLAEGEKQAAILAADAEKYRMIAEAIGNMKLLTPAKLEALKTAAWAKNKVLILPDKVALNYWGNNADSSPLFARALNDANPDANPVTPPSCPS